MKNNNKLILASASPRRLALLKQVSLAPDETIAADIDETPLKNEHPKNLVERLALAKGKAMADKHGDAFILSADTTVALGRRILEKPEDDKMARAFLKLLSGRSHKVLGGIAVYSPDGRVISRTVSTSVKFKPLSDQEIDFYIKSAEWEGKAGGYAIQGLAERFIKSINGSYSNVVGLSVYDTMQMLKGLGYLP